jgi:hypothetical protein
MQREKPELCERKSGEGEYVIALCCPTPVYPAEIVARRGILSLYILSA